MRSLRLFRSASPGRSAARAEVAPDGAGLLAFTSESAPATETAPVTSAPAAASGLSAGVRTRVALGVLGTVVALQAVPTGLWLRGRFAPAAGVASAAALPLVPPPTSFTAAAPCAPATEPHALAALEAAPPPKTKPVPAPAPAMVAGLLSVSAPVAMRVYLRGRLVGTTEADTIMLPVGTHELSLENAAVGYQARRTVTVQAGRTTALELDAPSGTVHVNAVPWAEVWIDNRRVGETPIGNLQIPVGSREVVFRHPQLGERRTSVLVTLKTPARVSMDMRAK